MQDTVRVDRQHYIGGSDIPAIMGHSKFTTRWTLLRQKAGLEVSDFEGNVYTEYGQTMEPKIRDYINATTGSMFTEGRHYDKIIIDGVEQEDIGIRCHTDGENDEAVLEIKTTSDIKEDVTEYKDYLDQLLFYMAKAKKEKGVLAVYERPDDFSTEFDSTRLQIWNINMSTFDALKDLILKEVNKFVTDRNKLIENPFLTEEDFLPKDLTVMADNVLALESRLNEFKEMEKEYNKQKESLLKAMQDANCKTWRTTGGYLITVVDAVPSTTTTVISVDEKALKEKHPRIYKQVLVATTTTKSGKKAFLKITSPKEAKNG